MIFLQAAARPTGPAAALLELAEISAIELLVSDATLNELQDVLNRPSLQRKFPSLTTALVADFIERIKLCSSYSANIPSVFPFDRDPKDAKYIDLAFAAPIRESRFESYIPRRNGAMDLVRRIRQKSDIHFVAQFGRHQELHVPKCLAALITIGVLETYRNIVWQEVGRRRGLSNDYCRHLNRRVSTLLQSNCPPN